MRGVLRPVIAGITAGSLLSLWLAKFVGTLTWGLTAPDPATFLMAAAILAGVGTLAGWLPARRASRIQPVAALRE